MIYSVISSVLYAVSVLELPNVEEVCKTSRFGQTW